MSSILFALSVVKSMKSKLGRMPAISLKRFTIDKKYKKIVPLHIFRL